MAEEFNFAERARGLVQDGQFQALPAERRMAVFRSFASKADPEGFGQLGEEGQLRIAAKVMGENAPGFLDTLKSGARAVGEFVGELPGVKPVQQYARTLAGQEGVDVEQRPITRRLIEAFATAGQTVGDGTGAGFQAVSGMDPQRGAREFEKAVSATATGRFVSEVSRDVAELIGGFGVARALVKGAASRFGLEKSSEMMANALGVGAGSAEEATALATQAARRKVIEKVTERVATDVTVGELFGVSHAIERGEVKPLEDFVVNPVLMATIGLGLMGTSAALKRFGPVRVQEATAALEGQGPGGADMKGVARDAQHFANALRKGSQLDKEAAGETLFKVATGKGELGEVRLIRDLMIADPSLVKNEFGLHMTRMLRPVLSTRVEVVEGPLRIRYEDPKTRRETLVTPTAEEARALAKQAERGELHVIEAKGSAREVAPFEAELGSRPSVVDGTEILGARHTEAASSVETRSTNPQVMDVERHTAAASNPIDMIEREQMRPLSGIGERQGEVYEGPLRPALTPFGDETGRVARPTTTERLGEVVSLKEPGGIERRPTTASRLGIPEPRPEPDTLVPLRGSAGQAAVISNTDPRGVMSRLPSGDVIISPFGPEGVELPRWLTTVPDAPSAPASKAVLGARTAAADVVGERPLTLTDPQGRTQRTVPDPMLKTVTVVDPVTWHAEVVTPDVVQKAIGEGRLKVDTELSGMSVEQLVARVDELASSPRLDIFEWRRALAEVRARTGITMAPFVDDASIARRLTKPFTSDQGSAILGPSGRNVETNLLTRQDPIAIQARALGGRARQSADGQIVVDFTFGKQRLSVSYGSKAEADAGLQSIVASRLEQARISEGMSRATKGRLGDAVALDSEMLDPLSRVRDAWELAPVGDVNRYTTGWATKPFEALVQPVARINRFGPAGQEFVQRLTAEKNTFDMRRGRLMLQLERELDGLAPAEVEKLVTSYEGWTATPRATAAMDNLAATARQQLAAGRQAGLDVAQLIEGRYAPHNFDVAQLRDKRAGATLIQDVKDRGFARTDEEAVMFLGERGLGTSREMIASNLIRDAKARGYAMTRTEAESVLDRYITENATRISGNMERGRIGVEGYITDARRAYAITFSRNARRLSEAEFFGPNDEHMLRLIDEIRDAAGIKAANYTKKVFDAVVGRDRIQLEGFGGWLYNHQTAKLSLSLLQNLQQPQNTGVRTGFLNMAKGLFEAGESAIAHPIKTLKRENPATQHAREVGAITSDILNDIQHNGLLSIDASLAKTVGQKVSTAYQGTLTAMFQVVEEAVNRAGAVPAGERYFMQQVERLRANPSDATAARRIRELGFKPDIVLKMNEADLTTVKYLSGQRVTNEGQFKSDALHMPLWARSPLGRFVFQFKSFSLNQVGFITNEVFGGHGDPARRVRAVTALLTTYPVIGATLAKVRSGLTGPTLASETIDEALQDPTVRNIIMAGLAGMAVSGALGIISDVALTQAIGGTKFHLMAALTAPAASSGINIFEAGRSVVQGSVSGDELKYQAAVRSAAREFGGVGTALARAAVGEPPKGGESAGGFGRGSGFGR